MVTARRCAVLMAAASRHGSILPIASASFTRFSKLAAASSASSPQLLRRPQTGWRPTRVVTDVDDTIKSSGNLRLFNLPLGGIDAQYSRGEFYPGVFQFGLELARHRCPRDRMPLRVAVLTARAREFLFALKLDGAHPVSVAYERCGRSNGVDGWGLGPVLYGSVKEWICSERKAIRKLENFNEILRADRATALVRGGGGGGDANGRFGALAGSLHASAGVGGAGSDGGVGKSAGPRPQYVFIGDTGEGDLVAGQNMCRDHPADMRGVFFHAVSCNGGGAVPLPPDSLVNGVPVLFFRTYVGAAVKAARLGLLDDCGLRRVIAAARADLEAAGVPRTASKWVDLERDIADARPFRGAGAAAVAAAAGAILVAAVAALEGALALPPASRPPLRAWGTAGRTERENVSSLRPALWPRAAAATAAAAAPHGATRRGASDRAKRPLSGGVRAGGSPRQ